MSNLLIITEKPSAAKNFAKALGGMSGTYDGKKYEIVALFGHMLQFVEPHLMVSDDLTSEFKSWEPATMPWDTRQMTWNRVPSTSKNPRTGKTSTQAGNIAEIKKLASKADAMVIATDVDPSGEGQLIGWEVIQAIGWGKDVKRMYFVDEAEKSLQKAFKEMKDLPHYSKDGDYVKANTRSQWDMISMQLTRLSTNAAQSQGYGVVIRQGRLKSVMTKLVADQLALIAAYVRKPYYEVKYKDDNGNTYTRKFDPDTDTFRFNDKSDAESDTANFLQSPIVKDSESKKSTGPGKLLDLGGLASILGTKGYKSKEVLATYQKMYEAKIVSYPRTEDKFISTEQFKEMLPHIDKIADLVGADKSLLTHRSPRKSHVKDGGAHGANRPGTTIPSSVSSLSKYGQSAEAIYDLLAKNFLAMFGENYEYNSIKAHVQDHPIFKATVNVPLVQGFKAIFDSDAETKDDDDDKEETSKGLGTNGDSFVAEGVNRKPPHPTHKWLERQLSRYDVGTGATRVGTLGEVTTGKAALLTDTKGRLNLTKLGDVASVLLDGSMIGDPAVTAKLYEQLKQAGEFKLVVQKIHDHATEIVKHDKEVFYRNAQQLEKRIGKPDKSIQQAPRKEKVTGTFKPTGQKIQFNIEWGGYKFTKDELRTLLSGEELLIKRKNGNTVGKLGEAEFKGNKFWGFQPLEAKDLTILTAPFPKVWSNYEFTKEDENRLRDGQEIEIKAVSNRTKKEFPAKITFGKDTYKGHESWKIIPDFGKKKKPAKKK